MRPFFAPEALLFALKLHKEIFYWNFIIIASHAVRRFISCTFMLKYSIQTNPIVVLLDSDLVNRLIHRTQWPTFQVQEYKTPSFLILQWMKHFYLKNVHIRTVALTGVKLEFDCYLVGACEQSTHHLHIHIKSRKSTDLLLISVKKKYPKYSQVRMRLPQCSFL